MPALHIRIHHMHPSSFRRFLLGSLAFPMLFTLDAAAYAGTFSVSPVRIYMKPRDRAAAITLMNEGDTEVALQAEVNAWTQTDDGRDEIQPTDDVILAPPIIKLPPHMRQVVRLALLRPADAARQLTFRLIVREVPEATSIPSGSVQIPITLALSMPVFITPPVAQRIVECGATAGEAGALTVSCANSGTAYAQVREITVRRERQVLARFEGGVYILPGARKSMQAKAEQAHAAGPVELEVRYDDDATQVFKAELR